MAATGTDTTTTGGTESPLDRLRYAIGQLSNQQKMLLMVAVAAVIALVVASSTWLKQADYRILFSILRNGTAAPSLPSFRR